MRWAKLIGSGGDSGTYAVRRVRCRDPAQGEEPRIVRALVPAFDGPGVLGESVATVLALRLQTTLRPYPIPNPLKLDFGRGKADWSQDKLEEQIPAAALRRASGR